MNRRIKLRVLLFALSALAILFAFDVGYSALNTIAQLDVVEAARDQWQRPLDVIRALDLRPGDVVADVGCGSGYFSLKLSEPVGRSGRVIAEDIRALPLAFLWVRTFLKGAHNVSIAYGQPADPHLPREKVDAVLISNTYHEFTDAPAILAHVRQSLIFGGLLVVVDRAPNAANVGVTETGEHEISADQVAMELARAGFDVVSRQDRLVERDPDNETWWLLVARKPGGSR